VEPQTESRTGDTQKETLSEEIFVQLEKAPKLHLSMVFLLLEIFIERRGFQYRGLREFQVEGIYAPIKKQGIFLIAPTASGKSLVAYFFLGKKIVDGSIGVYLVPSTQLLDQKVVDLEEFFRGYVQIMKMAGENRPTQHELRNHQDRLIIVATYESFRSFLFELQNRRYFTRQKVFGGVVVDEIHYLGDEDRGSKLESMLYKLQQEHAAQFCCLTGTFTREDAELWSGRLGCKLLYCDPTREFPLKEIVKRETKKNPSKMERKLARQEKMVKVLRECWEFIVNDHITKPVFTEDQEPEEADELVPQVHNAKMLIFCYTRRSSEMLAQKISWTFRNFFGEYFLDSQIDQIFSCQHMHAGIARTEQPMIFDRFNGGKGIRILCCSPILEVGIDVENIQTVMITDAERYTPTQLAQMAGRIRGAGSVIFLVADEPSTVLKQKQQLVSCLTICRQFIQSQLQKKDGDMEMRPIPKPTGKMLLLCPSGEHSEDLAKKLEIFIKALYHNRLTEEDFTCESLHGGLERLHQRAILNRFNQGTTLNILCWSYYVEPHLDVPDVDMFVIVDPERHDYIAKYLFQSYHHPWKEKAPLLFLQMNEIQNLSDKSLWQLVQEAGFADELEESPTGWVEETTQSQSDVEVSQLLYSTEGLWDYYSREDLYATKVITNRAFVDFKEKPVPDLRILGFHLSNLPPRAQTADMPRLILEALFRRQRTKKEIAVLLKPYEFVDYDLSYELKKLLADTFIRRNERKNKKGGQYSTTYIGDAIVTTGIDLDVARRGIAFFQPFRGIFKAPWLIHFLDCIVKLLNRSFPKTKDSSEVDKQFNQLYMNYLADEIARRDEKWKRSAIIKFIKRFNAENLTHNKELRTKFRISKGDEETLRRRAIWLAISFYSLFIGYHMHQRAVFVDATPYFQTQPRLFFKKTKEPKRGDEPSNTAGDLNYYYYISQKIQQRFLNVIWKFQRPRDKRTRKPQVRPHSPFTKKSLYAKYVRTILRKSKGKGATPQKIGAQLEQLDLKNQGRKLACSDSSINSVLTQSMKDEVYRRKENEAVPHRPRYRYWLKRYKPPPPREDQCKDCHYFVRDPTKRTRSVKIKTYCNKQKIARTSALHACQEFRPLIDTQIRVPAFDVLRNEQGEITEVRCPQCRKWGTLLIPTFKYLTICTHCNTLYRQTKLHQYIGQSDVFIHQKRVIEKMGFPVIKVDSTPKRIFLERNRSLILKKRRRAKLHVIYTYYHNRFRQMYFFDEVEIVLVAGGELSPEDERTLENHGIQVFRYPSERVSQIEANEIKAVKYRQLLKTLDEQLLKDKANDLITAKMKSNIAYTLELSKKILPFELGLDFALDQLDYIMQLFIEFKERDDTRSPLDSISFINKLRSCEGNAEKAIWVAIALALPPVLKFKGRQAYRYAKTSIYYGAKAFDPYNAGLNYLYFLLYKKVTRTLGLVGFSEFYPGSGLLHRRHGSKHIQMKDESSKKQRFKRTKKNQEIIFDFMDAYRPPFRHHLMQAFRELTLQPEDFKWGYDEWKRKVYYVPKKSKVKYQLQKLFKEVWEREFYYQKKGWRTPRKRSLKTIMLIDALDFERFLSRKYIRHTPFHAYEDPQIKAFVDFFYELFEFITQYKAPSTTSLPKVIKTKRRRSTSTRALPQNVIIVTHNDWDGFASALLLLLKNYDHHPNIRIIVAHNKPTRPLFIRKVLKRQVRRLLLKEAYNRIIVADFAINWTEGFFHELKRSYEQALGDFKSRFEISWYDHHTQPRADLDNLRMKVGMNIHYNPRMDTYRIIWREMYDEFIKLDKRRRELSVILNLFKTILKHQSSTIPPRLNQLLRTLSISFSKYLKQLGKKQARDLFFIFDLSRKGRVNKKPIRDYLDKWYKWFQYYWRKESHRPKNWTQLFMDIVLLKKVPQVPLQPQDDLPLSEPPVHISRHQTRGGQTFDALISRHPTSFEGVMPHLPRPHPQILLSQWEDYAISVRSLDRAVKVIGLLLDQGNIRAHETTGPIYFLRKPRLRLTRMDPVRSKEITINGVGFLDELAERLVRSTKLSADPHDLFPMEIGDIEKHEIKLPGVHFFAKDEATQAEIGKLVRKGRKGVLHIAFPCGKILLLEYGITTLFFTFLRNENNLSYFLHYLLRSYLADTRCQTAPNPQKCFTLILRNFHSNSGT